MMTLAKKRADCTLTCLGVGIQLVGKLRQDSDPGGRNESSENWKLTRSVHGYQWYQLRRKGCSTTSGRCP